MTSQMKNVRAFAAATAFCHSNEVRQEPMVRGLSAGGEWIRTFGSAMRLHRRRTGRPAHRHRAHHPIPKILDPHSPDKGAIFSAFAAVLS
jgi:hypothetical protein